MRIALPSGPRLMTCTASDKKAKEKFGGNDLVKTWWKDIVFTHQPLGVWRDQIRLELPVCFGSYAANTHWNASENVFVAQYRMYKNPLIRVVPSLPSPPTCAVWAIHGKHIVAQKSNQTLTITVAPTNLTTVASWLKDSRTALYKVSLHPSMVPYCRPKGMSQITTSTWR